MRTGLEAAEYGAEIQRIVRYLGISNGNMAVRTSALDSAHTRKFLVDLPFYIHLQCKPSTDCGLGDFGFGSGKHPVASETSLF